MEQKAIHILESYEQLKVISDPLRTKILMFLVEKPHTVHQLAHLLTLSRAKVLYHVRELEKHDLIRLVRTEEQGGNLLKYYQAIARGYIPADHLLNFVETNEATRQSYLEVLDRAKTRVLTAPTATFSPSSSNVEDWMSLSLQKELTMSEADFQRFATKYRALLDEFTRSPSLDKKDKKHFYIMTTAFAIDEPLFENDEV